jgi:hypothetical protein
MKKNKTDKTNKIESFKGLTGNSKFAKTSLDEMRKAGRKASKIK